MSAERPKRHAPKKFDPDFIADPFITSRQFIASAYPPRKKLALSQNEVPIPVASQAQTVNSVNSSKTSIMCKKQSAVRSQDTGAVKPTNGIINRAGLACSSSLKGSSTGSALPCSDPEKKTKMKSSCMATKSKKSLGDSYKTYKVKECERAACTSSAQICFAGCSTHCTGNGYTSHWNHISDGEHFCNSCFEHFYRSYKDGYAEYAKWKHVWSINGQSEPNVKNYMADQKLPYWLQCNKCKKWRQLSCKLKITPEFVRQYQCGYNLQGIKKETSKACEHDEDERVLAVRSEKWLRTLYCQCFLQQSPAAALMRNYYQDSVGLSPYYNMRECISNDSTNKCDKESGLELPSWSKPFMEYSDDTETAFCFSPSQMTSDEMKAFPEYSRLPQVYLAVRNLVVTLWSMDCKKPITVERCQHHLICRGLVRIRCVQELQHVIKFLSLHGYINTGFISQLPKEVHPTKVEQLHVIVVGAGAAGISVASHLYKFGAQVTVLEAKEHAGGRCRDNKSLGLCIGEGAQIINCTENNPLSVLCDQVSAKLQQISDRCDLYQENGQITSPTLDRRIDFHFNAMLDNVAEWRKDKNEKHDVNLMDKIEEMHKEFKDESSMNFTEEEEKLLHFHCANMEFACGASLDKISALYWDQNENYPQFSGSPHFVSGGFERIFSKLAEGLDIKYGTQVTKIDYASEEVTVMTSDGCSYHGDRVVVTVPLAVLQKGVIEFNPPLPEKKTRAIKMLGCGQVEKIALQFPYPFWIKKTKGADFFGHVPESKIDRGQFGVFYHIKPKNEKEGPFVLLTHICGKALNSMADKTEEQIVEECVRVLAKLFPEEDVPAPINSLVTHWKDDPHISMAYVHVPVGCSGEIFDDLAEMVDEKVHFAGEATNRQFPQSVTGAYLSGIREAYLILTGLELDLGVKDNDIKLKAENRLDNSVQKQDVTLKMEQNNGVGVLPCDPDTSVIDQSCDHVNDVIVHS